MKIGDKVHYIPFRNCDPSLYENGIIKEIVDTNDVRVVYHCADDWENYADYTSALTAVIQLREGWYDKEEWHGEFDI